MTKQRPTLADVARVAGVSRATASRAINGAYGISAESRDRVRAVAARRPGRLPTSLTVRGSS
ncbi:LacI family DNA-binding transcriptional regulator [Actinoplanes oblitus]|uniref:LacI family DNA-binding transcriptional regulator n=1 Tax=Actinoplanes oblitus TaxID=3040509 RepID=A0ABY8WUQ1_9ACTN|nr:LacI family DNA-binding transcriptional regulator [Actinoplanes oblitus]WIM99630.1 LacI family DNA-binding transcriptional regulator [Actinoplanes oblitus]